jgi:hypothetical protein
MPRSRLTDVLDFVDSTTFRAGSLHLRAHGCPDPDRAIVRSRRPRKGAEVRNTVRSPKPVSQRALVQAQTLRVERAYQAMLDAQDAVKAARDCGDHETRAACAITARERRAEWLAVSPDGLERRTIEVDQGSAVNPMVAV